MGLKQNTYKNLSKRLLLLSIIFTIIALNGSFSIAAEDGCCINPAPEGCSTATSAAECLPNGTFNADACTQIDICTLNGWCCLTEETGYMTQDKCSSSTFIPSTNPNLNSCNVNEISVIGTVKYSNGANASSILNVYVNDETGELVSSATTSHVNANYSVNLLRGFTFYLTATSTENDSCSVSQIISLDENSANPTIQNLVLPCTNPEIVVPPCQQEWSWTWENETGQCGHRLGLVQTNPSCTSGIPPQPAGYVPCVQNPAPTCNVNGILETGEQCDPLIPLADVCTNYINPETGTSYVGGALSCTSGCTISTEGCLDCPATEAGCADNRFCSICSICSASTLCVPECKPIDKITDVVAKPIPNILQKGIGLTWDIPDLCTTSTITIKRCTGKMDEDVCTSSQLPIAVISGNAVGYSDVPLVGAGKYCYNVSAQVTTGVNTFTINSDGLVCAKLPDDVCMGQKWDGSYFCNGDSLTSCDENGKETGSQTCVGGCYGPTGDPNAPTYECKITEVCESCNGPFGLYPDDYALTVGYNSCGEAEQDNACYLDDYSTLMSLIGEYKSCTEVKSCYEYSNQQSCTNNPCDIIGAENCKWINYTGTKNELGLGVCIPQEPEEQDCTKCTENGILGNYCPEDICKLFGDAGKCFYNSNTSNVAIDKLSCMNVEHVGCETYDTKTQCIGSNNNNFTANVIYDGTGSSRINPSNNAVTQDSNDLYGRNRCVWLDADNKCVKDSDSNSQFDLKSDCSGASLNNETCLLDFVAPETQLFVLDQQLQENGIYSKTQLNYLSASANEPIKNTHYSIGAIVEEPPVQSYYEYAYPTKTRSEFINSITNLVEGKYKIYYYSEDKHKNLEEVKSTTFELIKGLSDLSVTWTNVSVYNLNSDQYLTNLTVNVNYDSNLNCQVNLTEIADPTKQFAGNARKSTPNLNWLYQDLTDGAYTLTVVCADEHMQREDKTYEIDIDVDTTIKNPEPRGTTFKPGPITLSIETTEDGKCYYNNDPNYVPPENPTTYPGQAQWTQFTSTGHKVHTATINAQQEGMHFYYTGCNFPAFNRNYFGNTGDMIYFAIDNSSPKLTLIDVATEENYTNSTAKESVSLKLICDDYNPLLDDWSSRPYSFGCNSVKYNVYYNDTTYGYSQPVTITSGETRIFYAPTRFVKTYLNVILNDTGGNSLKNYSVFLNLRNFSYVPPNVTICDPENASSCI